MAAGANGSTGLEWGFSRAPLIRGPDLGPDPLYGYAFAPPGDPLDRKVDPRVVYRDVQILSNTGTWTYPGILKALSDQARGLFVGAADLVDALFGDDRVQATLGSRTGALFGRDVTHHAPITTDQGIECMAAWRAAWPSFAPQSVMAELKRWAIMLGFSVAEILWQRDWVTILTLPNGNQVQRQLWRPYLKPWHPKFVYYRWDIRRYVATTIDGPVVIEPGNGKWFLHAPFGAYRGWMHASNRAIADKWFIKQLAWRDWARWNERHGLPIIKAKIPAAGDPAQKTAFVNALGSLTQEAVLGLPQNVDGTGYDAEMLEARDRGFETFGKAIDRAESAMTLAIKFQNLTTEVEEGSFAAARQHGHTEQAGLEFDESTLALDVHEQCSRAFALFNYGDAELATWTRWDVTPTEDYKANGEAWKAFCTGVRDLAQSGYRIRRRALSRIAQKQLGVRVATRDLEYIPPAKVGLGGGQ